MSTINKIETLKLMLGIKERKIDDLFDLVEKTKDAIITDAKNEIANQGHTIINDAYGNSLTNVGTDDKVKSFTNYGFSNETMNWPLWLALYNDSWVFRRAIDKPAQDMVRSGITIDLDNIEANVVNDVYSIVKAQRKSLIELLQWGRLFGGAVAVMMFDNFTDEDYSKTINIEKLKKAKRMTMYVTDRWYGCSPSDSTVKDMNNICDYGKPVSYRITFSNGHDIRVHHDYILRYEGRTAPQLIKTGPLQGWGYAEGTHLINELARDDELKASITSLINKSLIEVIKMPGMRGLFMGQDDENVEQIQKRLEMVNWARTYNSLTFLDSDDEYQEHGFSGLAGLSDLLEKNMWLISAALERYDETINNLNENYFRTCMHKLLLTIYKWKGIQEDVSFEFGSLIRNKQDKDRLDGIKSFQEVLSSLLADGVLTPKQCAIAIKNYAEKGTIDLGISQDDIDKMDDELKDEMEDVDLNNATQFGGNR